MKRMFLLALCFVGLKVIAEDTGVIDKNSIYQLQSSWKNIENKDLQLKSFLGEKVIIGMVYTGCANACPMTISKLQEVEKDLGKSVNYKIVLASFDFKKDTPEHLKEYLKSRKLDPQKWVFLSAPQESTARELAVLLGISYKAIGDGDFSHSNVITYLDEKGVVQAKMESLSSENAPFVAKMKAK